MPIELDPDGKKITISDETVKLDPDVAEWFAKQPDAEVALHRVLETGAATMQRHGHLEFDGETQQSAPGSGILDW